MAGGGATPRVLRKLSDVMHGAVWPGRWTRGYRVNLLPPRKGVQIVPQATNGKQEAQRGEGGIMEAWEMTEQQFVEGWLKFWCDQVRESYYPHSFPQELRALAFSLHKSDDDICRDIEEVWRPRLVEAHRHILAAHHLELVGAAT